jgi:hypothetical protein
VDFETDDRLVFREDFGRDGHGLGSGFRHKESNIIASGFVRNWQGSREIG